MWVTFGVIFAHTGFVATADGDVHWQQWTNRAILDAAGEIVEYQCVGRDITERKRAEQEVETLNRVLEDRVRERTEQLRASEAQFQSLFHTTPLGMAITTAEGRFIDTNPAFQRIVGRAGAELQALTFADVTHPADLQESRRASRELLEGTRDLVPLVKRYLRPDGRLVWADVSVTAIRGPSGAYRYGFAMIQDATERKNEEAIRTGEQRALVLLAQDASLEEALAALIEALREPDPEMLSCVLLVDGDGKRLWYGAAPHLPEEYKRQVNGVEIGPSCGSCGTAAYRRERVIVEDVATDPRWAAYRAAALEHGLRGCWSEPIISAAGTTV